MTRFNQASSIPPSCSLLASRCHGASTAQQQHMASLYV